MRPDLAANRAIPMQKRLFLLAFLTGAYVVVVRRIYAFLPWLTSGDTFLLKPNIAWGLPETWAPYVVGGVAILGLVSRWGWAWWLTVAALLVEVTLFVPRAIPWAGVSLFTLATWIKLGWLVAIAWLLVSTCRLGG